MSQLTEQDIEEMERAEKAAEAGPWGTDTSVCVVTSQESDIASVEYPGDARFIARARSFVPAAIADLRRLRAENERLEAACRDLAEVAIMRESVASQTAREVDFQRVSADLTAATERAERAERERDRMYAVYETSHSCQVREKAIADTQEQIAKWLGKRATMFVATSTTRQELQFRALDIRAGAWRKEQP